MKAEERMAEHSVLDVPAKPAAWKTVPLGVVLEDIVGGGTPSRANPAYWEGNIPWLTVKDMRSRRPQDSIDHISEDAVRGSATNLIPADTVIIATRIGLGKVIRVPYDATINQDLKALITKPIVDKGYLEYWIVSIANYLDSIGSGTTVKGIRLEQLRSIPFPLAPLDQQKRIVAEIEKQFSRLDEAVANLKRVKANFKRYKAAVLKAAVEGKLTAAWRKQHPDTEPASELLKRILAERRAKWEQAELAKMQAKGKTLKDNAWKNKYSDPPAPDTTRLPELPVGWVWVTVEALAFVTKLAGFEYTKYVKYDESGDHAVIKAENAGREGFKKTEYSRIHSATVAQLTRSKLEAGDLLMVFVGAGTGNVARVPGDQPYFLGPNIAMIRAESPQVTPEYLEIFLRSPLGNLLALDFAKAVAQPSLSMGSIRKISVAIPSLREQHSIVAEVERHLSLAAEAVTQVNVNIQRAERLRQSILTREFSGGTGDMSNSATQLWQGKQ